MNIIRTFENMTGGRWTGISFHGDIDHGMKKKDTPMHFCEAVMESSRTPITLTMENLNCAGARWSLGWNDKEDENLIKKIMCANNIEYEAASAMIHSSPRITDKKIKAVTIGVSESPDIVVSFLQPEAAMKLVQQWSRIHGKNIDLSVSSIMAVCGSVAAGAYTRGGVCCSFGCPDARNRGKIGRDRMIIGIPANLAKALC